MTEPNYPSGPPLHTQPEARVSPPVQEPGWHADPMGRHQFRYWDGSFWTDHVADGGTASIDPVVAAPRPFVSGPAPMLGQAVKRRRSKGPLIVGLVVVLALLAVGALFLIRRAGDGSGTFARELEARGDTLRHPVQVPDDSVVLIRVATDDGGFNPVIGFSGDPETVDEYVDFFGSDAVRPDDEFPGTLPEDAQLLAVADGFEAGEDEVTFVGTPIGGDFDVLVTGSGDSTGAFDLEISIEEFAGPDDPAAYIEELAAQDFVQNFEAPRSPIEDILDDFIDEADEGD